MSESVGLIGLGLLGSALAERLMTVGFDVMGFDVDAGCLQRFASTGGRPAKDVADVARQCRRIVMSLPDAEVSRTVVDQLLPQLVPAAVIIDTTTGDPAVMQQIGETLAAGGIGYLDATIAGSSTQVQASGVLVLIGGDDAQVADSRDLLEAISPQTIHVGPRGSGARMKLVVNLVLGLHRAVLAEGLTFARSLGFDPQSALDVLVQSPAASAVMQTKGEKMVTGDFTPQARLRQHLKDVRLILEAADEGCTPLSQVHAGLLQSLVDRGFGDEDNSVVIRAFEQRSRKREDD